MFRTPCLVLLAVGLTLTLVPQVNQAQQTRVRDDQRDPLSSPNGVPHLAGERANALLIVAAPAVQSELKLTEAQVAKVRALAKSATSRTRGREDGPDPSGLGEAQ